MNAIIAAVIAAVAGVVGAGITHIAQRSRDIRQSEEESEGRTAEVAATYGKIATDLLEDQRETFTARFNSLTDMLTEARNEVLTLKAEIVDLKELVTKLRAELVKERGRE